MQVALIAFSPPRKNEVPFHPRKGTCNFGPSFSASARAHLSRPRDICNGSRPKVCVCVGDEIPFPGQKLSVHLALSQPLTEGLVLF